MGIWYASREDVQAELDSKSGARMNPRIARAIDSASRAVEGLTRRRFYPEVATRKFDWPGTGYAPAYRLWLGEWELISLTALSSGGITIAPSSYFLEPNQDGAPYDRIDLNRGGSATYGGGSTNQQDITATGTWGYDLNEDPAGALAGGINATTATVTVTNAAVVGVGNLVRCGTERMIVIERQSVTTGQTLQADMTASTANDSCSVSTGSAYAIGEVITLNTERMLIVDILGNALQVKRAYDGSVLAAHSGSTIYASRQLTVTRAALGTTAATHNAADLLYVHAYPGSVREFTVAIAVQDIQMGIAGWTGQSGSGENARDLRTSATNALRTDVKNRYARRARVMAV